MTRDEIEAEAAAWTVRCVERELSPEEQRQLDDWLAKDSRCLGAYVRARSIWADIDRIAAISAPVSMPNRKDDA